MKQPIVLDFETEAIDDRRPHVPPKPVGVAVRWPGKRSRYFAWGHPTANNCDRATGHDVVRDAWRSSRPLLFHNAAFDVAVATHYFGLPWLPPERIEDTMLLLWLANPYIPLGLKDAAAAYCDMPPDEQDALRDWILAHVPEMKRKRKGWGAHISKAPGDLVGRYAVGDVERTLALWKALKPVRDTMPERYRKEVAVLEVADDMTKRGIPLDVSGLEEFHETGSKQAGKMAAGIRRSLGVSKLFDLGKRDAVADALEARGWVKPNAWVRTGKAKKRSTNVHDLRRVCGNRAFAERWGQYQLLSHMLSTFVGPWLDLAENGRYHAEWNTVMNYEEGRKRGAKTGRLSTSRIQNIAKEEPEGGLPSLRSFIAAPRGRRLVCGDLSQQEPRLAAHFAGGGAALAYQDDPNLDDHLATAQLMGVPRDTGKQLNLASYYALGLDALAGRLGCTRDEAQRLRAVWRRARPAVAKLDQDLRRAWAQGQPIRTWGGAVVYVEEGDPETGRTWEYRALNTLIQRSAAEQLKEIMLAWWGSGFWQEAPMALTAHDEGLLETPTKLAHSMRQEFRAVLEHDYGFDVPFIGDVGVGKTWWEAKP